MQIGLERIQKDPGLAKHWGRTALLCNQASLTRELVPAWRVLQDILGKRLVAFFGPQHGMEATVQDNMIETGHARHLPTGLPVYSLYSETREPSDAMLEGVDTIAVDIQITGCRVYTFKYTIAACLRAAKRLGRRVVVLDRPNPLGGEVMEGRVLEMDSTSFVGEFPIPMRHGLTVGEAARLFNQSIGAELEVITMEGWRSSSLWSDLERHWVLTSPNLPTADSVYVYPGTVIFEGTNLSEGRGTTLPFQFIGAPYLGDGVRVAKRVQELYGADGGVHLRAASFQPTSQKWQGQICHGVHIIVTDPARVRSFDLGIAILRAAIELGGDQFAWKEPGYEYDFETLPIKLILGSRKAVDELTKKAFSVSDSYWQDGIAGYRQRVEPHYLYPR